MWDHLPRDLVRLFIWRSCEIIYLEIVCDHLSGDLVG